MTPGSQLNVAVLMASLLCTSIWQSCALTVCTELLLRLAPGISAANRFRLWMLTCGVCCLLPMIELGQRILEPAASSLLSADVTLGVSLSLNVARGLLAVWAVAAGASVLRLGAGMLSVKRMIATAREAPAALAALQHRVDHSGICVPKLLISGHIFSPVAVGFVKPSIVLPASLVNSLSEEQMVALLQHETQHLTRRDGWTALGLAVLRAILPLNPALWFIDRRLTAAREMACDDGVLAAGVPAKLYADCLARVAELTFNRRVTPFAAAFLGTHGQTLRRIDHILSSRTPDSLASRLPLWTLLALTVISGFLIQAPDLISFREPVTMYSSSPAKSAQESSADEFDYLASPSVYPSASPVRPPSMPVLHFPAKSGHPAVTGKPKGAHEA